MAVIVRAAGWVDGWMGGLATMIVVVLTLYRLLYSLAWGLSVISIDQTRELSYVFARLCSISLHPSPFPVILANLPVEAPVKEVL